MLQARAARRRGGHQPKQDRHGHSHGARGDNSVLQLSGAGGEGDPLLAAPGDGEGGAGVKVAAVNPFDGDEASEEGGVLLPSRIVVWRSLVVALHIILFASTVSIWTLNRRGKWSGVTRAWSHSYMQLMSVQKYPVPVQGGTPGTENATLTGVQYHGSLLWPRWEVRDPVGAVYSYDCNNDTVLEGGHNLYSFEQEGRGGGVFGKQKSCQQNSIVPTYDYATTFGILAFLGSVDVATFTVLCAWISLGYSIFSIPNESHEEDETPASESGQGWWGLWCNRIMAFLWFWNLLGVALVYFLQGPAQIPISTVFTCATLLLWTTAVQTFWILVGRSASTLLFSLNRIIETHWDARKRNRTTQYWVEFAKVNEASAVVPLLLICCVSARMDSALLYDMQYVFGFVSTGVALLVIQDIVGTTVQEQITYNILARGGDGGDAIFSAGLDACTSDIVRGALRFSWRVTVVSMLLVGWGLWVYYRSVGPWVTGVLAQRVPPPTWGVVAFAPAYPLGIIALNVIRNYARFHYTVDPNKSSGEEQAAYQDQQRFLSTAYTVLWDVYSFGAKIAISVTLASHALDAAQGAGVNPGQ